MTRQSITTKLRGDYGEAIACRYLMARGFTIRTRNYMPARGVKRGEIDIVAEKDGAMHFVEVKTRFINGKSDTLTDPPEAQITVTKLRALSRAAQMYMRKEGLMHAVYHFDALAITVFLPQKRAQVRFLQDIFL